MNARLSKGNVVRTGKRHLGLAGLASLALLCAGEVLAQSQPAQTQSTVARPVAVATAPAISPGAQPSNARAAAGQGVAQSSSAKAPARKGRPDGIAVSGWWTIEVRNPDGRVVTHREFENALTSAGQSVLADVLSNPGNPAGYVVLGSWSIALCNNGGTDCYLATTTGVPNVYVFDLEQPGSWGGSPSNCTGSAFNATAPPYVAYCYPTLTMPQPSALLVNGSVLSLSGNVPSSPLSGNLNIDTVETVITECIPTLPQSTSPLACFTNSNGEALTLPTFTLATVSPAVSVQPMQSVSVTVQFSFSPVAAISGASVPKAAAIRH